MSDARLMLGDCLDILKTLPDASVDAVVTDPPYGINTKSDGMGKLNPWSDLCNSALWCAAWIGECRRILKPNGCLWSCLNWRSMVTFQKASCDLGWPIESLLVWDKCWIGPAGPKQLRPSYEMVALWAMPDFLLPDRCAPDIVRVKWSSYKPSGHPAEKPIGLMRFCVEKAATPENSVILDPFMGSGTVGQVCVEMNRSFIGVEQDERWMEGARRRIEAAQNATHLLA